MILKRVPEDFQVEEITDRRPAGGPYALYRLTKRGVGTLEAVEIVARGLGRSTRDVDYGGLKDRHAMTRQYVTVRGGSRRGFRDRGVVLEYLGQTDAPFSPADIVANRFAVTLRNVSPTVARAAEGTLATIARDGFPNYFDDQRFGSIGDEREFVATHWIAGRFERALWLALAGHRSADAAAERTEKEILRAHWGDWSACRRRLSRSHRRSIVAYLEAKPGDFRGAFARIRQDMRSLYLAAFQSHLWNRCLAALLRESCPASDLVPIPLRMGAVPCFTRLSETVRARLAGVALPLPSARLRLPPGRTRDLVERVLSEEGWVLRRIRVKYPRDSFFAKGERPAVVAPLDLAWTAAPDDLYPGRRRIHLHFVLPRGAYATILIKRLGSLAVDEGCRQ